MTWGIVKMEIKVPLGQNSYWLPETTVWSKMTRCNQLKRVAVSGWPQVWSCLVMTSLGRFPPGNLGPFGPGCIQADLSARGSEDNSGVLGVVPARENRVSLGSLVEAARTCAPGDNVLLCSLGGSENAASPPPPSLCPYRHPHPGPEGVPFGKVRLFCHCGPGRFLLYVDVTTLAVPCLRICEFRQSLLGFVPK